MDPPPPPPPPPSTVPLLGPPHHEGGCLDSCYWEYSHFAVYGFCAAVASSHAAARHCSSLCHLPPEAAFL
ncbi:hypothetical protein NC652_022614 [Populus alba x Populus x berolinensis]|nr:hypothetical protein NC652_022614 [Populus alba x Populus x berolinensis]